MLLPVLLLGILYLYDHQALIYRHAQSKRIVFLLISFSVLYGWIALDANRRRQERYIDIGIQSSFYVYVFMVLTLTGYFILFREISVLGWWENMQQRVSSRDRVNLKLFQIFRIYRLGNKQILGNLVMLLPLGIYLPLLFPAFRRFWAVLLGSLFVSAGIELLQLITRFRSADVDDVLLNTLGACLGYGIYAAGKALFTRRKTQTPVAANRTELLA